MPNAETPKLSKPQFPLKGKGRKESQVLGKDLHGLATCRMAASCQAEQMHGSLLRHYFLSVFPEERTVSKWPEAFRKTSEGSGSLYVFLLF